jgi:hypothetical protein
MIEIVCLQSALCILIFAIFHIDSLAITSCRLSAFSAQLLFGLLAKGVNAADPATSHQMLTQVLAVLCNIGENSEAAINTIMQVRRTVET